MKVKNKHNGVVSDIPADVWEKVKDEKHVKGVLIPVPPPEVPQAIKDLEARKAEREKTKQGKPGKVVTDDIIPEDDPLP